MKTKMPSREKTSAALIFAGGNFMPKKAKRVCRISGYPNLTQSKSGYCLEHEKTMQRHYDKFTRGYNAHERYGGNWKKIRDRYISQNPLCEKCRAKGKFTAGSLVHHIKPLSEGGTNEEGNLMTLCVSCHEKIHRRRGI